MLPHVFFCMENCYNRLVDGKFQVKKEKNLHSIESPFLDMEKITDSGQIFRLRRIGEKGFVLVAKNRVLRIKVQDPDRGAY